MSSLARTLLAVLSIASLVALPASSLGQLVRPTEYLVAGQVVDAETGEPIRSFRVIPGSSHRRPGNPTPLAIWQPHLIRDMSDGKFLWPRARGYRDMRLRIEAEGYLPAMTPWTGKDKPQIRPVIRLQPAKMIRGIVIGGDGMPAAGATISVSLPNSTVRIDGCEFARNDETPDSLADWWRIPRMIRCDDEGQFELPAESDPTAVLCIVHPSGYLGELFEDVVARMEDGPDVQLTLQKWARVEGRVCWLNQPGVDEVVTLSVHKSFKYPGMIDAYPKATTDEDGRFVIEYVPPGRIQIAHPVKLPAGTVLSPMKVRFDYPVFHEELKPGETKQIDIGGKGVVVTGRLTGLKSYQGVTLSIAPPAPDTFGWFKMGAQGGGQDLTKGFQALAKSSYGPLYFREQLTVESDGTFKIENTLTGNYELSVRGAVGATTFSVSPSTTETMDLGEINVVGLPDNLPDTDDSPGEAAGDRESQPARDRESEPAGDEENATFGR